MSDNPKDRHGIQKAGLCAIPLPPIFEAGVVMTEGAAKYGRHNWRAAPVRASVYVDAAFRHLAQWFEGEDVDVGSKAGTSNLASVIACMVILRDAQLRGTLVDDRPPQSPGFLPDLHAMVERINAAYPEPVAPFTAQSEKDTTPDA